MLDAETWQEKKEIPLDIGRRFFRVKGEDQPLPELGEVRRRGIFAINNFAWGHSTQCSRKRTWLVCYAR